MMEVIQAILLTDEMPKIDFVLDILYLTIIVVIAPKMEEMSIIFDVDVDEKIEIGIIF